jgi:hypothetical protein
MPSPFLGTLSLSFTEALLDRHVGDSFTAPVTPIVVKEGNRNGPQTKYPSNMQSSTMR